MQLPENPGRDLTFYNGVPIALTNGAVADRHLRQFKIRLFSAIQHPTDFVGQDFDGEGLLDKLNAFVKNALMRDNI